MKAGPRIHLNISLYIYSLSPIVFVHSTFSCILKNIIFLLAFRVLLNNKDVFRDFLEIK